MQSACVARAVVPKRGSVPCITLIEVSPISPEDVLLLGEAVATVIARIGLEFLCRATRHNTSQVIRHRCLVQDEEPTPKFHALQTRGWETVESKGTIPVGLSKPNVHRNNCTCSLYVPWTRWLGRPRHGDGPLLIQGWSMSYELILGFNVIVMCLDTSSKFSSEGEPRRVNTQHHQKGTKGIN
ncbi:UNVERIFIED_CONTAM: hypothetical protein Slati_3090900 [Sesamum latifolium]|uniref:Uncharacterized protein n=1 Tax=Sesamum latifolium TaxID=2727402 RepID=A0AAW2UUS7_9LAMI